MIKTASRFRTVAAPIRKMFMQRVTLWASYFVPVRLSPPLWHQCSLGQKTLTGLASFMQYAFDA